VCAARRERTLAPEITLDGEQRFEESARAQ
jgi:hypothetical protein